MLSSNGFASSTEILNLADQLKPKKMKKVEAELVLQRLVQDKWLSEVWECGCGAGVGRSTWVPLPSFDVGAVEPQGA